jgi:hypothetical protein
MSKQHSGVDGCQAAEISIAELVGQVYEAAPATERTRLLEQLLRPLGVLALLAVADGVFAKIRFQSGWQQMQVRLEDVQRVQAGDVVALAERVQQVSTDALDGVARLLMASPMLAGSAAAALLLAALLQGRRSRRTGDDAMPGAPANPGAGPRANLGG